MSIVLRKKEFYFYSHDYQNDNYLELTPEQKDFMKNYSKIFLQNYVYDISFLADFNYIVKLTLKKFNRPIKILPKNIRYLILSDRFNQSIDILKNYDIRKLRLGRDFNNNINNLPINLEKLFLGMKFNNPVGYYQEETSEYISFLPKTLKELVFLGAYYGEEGYDYSTFNHPLNPYLPEGIKTLVLSDCYEQSIDNLPNGLEKLTFGMLFNGLVENLPNTLKKIHFGNNFNSPVDFLPINLEELIFQGEFNQSLDNLPVTLKKLIFVSGDDTDVRYYRCSFNRPLDNLPIGLKVLNMEVTEFKLPFNNLPSSLVTLYLPDFFNDSLVNLPEKLESLYLGHSFYGSLENLPENVRHVQFGSSFRSWETVPEHLKYISFECHCGMKIKKLPVNLERIIFSSVFNKSIDHLFKKISKKLQFVFLDYSFEKSIDNLPDCVNTLIVRGEIKKPKKLPMNLKNFIYEKGLIDVGILPEGLKLLCCNLESSDLMFLPDNLEVLDIISINKETLIKKEELIIKDLPTNLKILAIGFLLDFDKYDIFLKKPLKIETAYWDDSWWGYFKIEELPESLEYLFINGFYPDKDDLLRRFPNVKIIFNEIDFEVNYF